MEIDIKKVGALYQDRENNIIRVLDENENIMWTNSYHTREAMDKVFGVMTQKFIVELERRKNLKRV